jgi:hypothetical protein
VVVVVVVVVAPAVRRGVVRLGPRILVFRLGRAAERVVRVVCAVVGLARRTGMFIDMLI